MDTSSGAISPAERPPGSDCPPRLAAPCPPTLPPRPCVEPRYVQCYSCGNPETVVKLKKENILLKCKACGFTSEVGGPGPGLGGPRPGRGDGQGAARRELGAELGGM